LSFRSKTFNITEVSEKVILSTYNAGKSFGDGGCAPAPAVGAYRPLSWCGEGSLPHKQEPHIHSRPEELSKTFDITKVSEKVILTAGNSLAARTLPRTPLRELPVLPRPPCSMPLFKNPTTALYPSGFTTTTASLPKYIR